MALLPSPTPSVPTTNFKFLENGFKYLMYTAESATSPDWVVGLPLRTSQSGQIEAFVHPEVPIVTINNAAEQIQVPGKDGLYLRVVAYKAKMSADGTTIVVAPPQTQSHRDGHYVVPFESLVQQSHTLHPLKLEAFNGYVAAEDRTVKIEWKPPTLITRETIQALFSGNDDMIESIKRIGETECWVTFRSPYAIGPILGGHASVQYGTVLISSEKAMMGGFGANERMLYINFDVAITDLELRTYFQRFGAVTAVALSEVEDGNQQPRSGVLLFQTPEAVSNTLRGAQVRTFYIDEREVRVRPAA